ncbi:MAG: hypothetical protein INF64_06765 [Roseomonas sp.]|jgi:hypothetical protein|nr:hypothetical protein [Roseomonas sp.]
MSDAPDNVSTNGYEFTQDWFSRFIPTWDRILTRLKPSKHLFLMTMSGPTNCLNVAIRQECQNPRLMLS